MKHPFQDLDAKRRARLWRWITVGTVINMVILGAIGQQLTTEAAPQQIVTFEFAGTPEEAARIVASWEGRKGYALASLLLDFPFLLLYSNSIALAALWAGTVFDTRRIPVGLLAGPLAWGQWVAAGLDASENAALLWMLYLPPVQPWPAIAYVCAAIKFLLVILGLLYVIAGVGALAIPRPRN